jgi:hypothetical protein
VTASTAALAGTTATTGRGRALSGKRRPRTTAGAGSTGPARPEALRATARKLRGAARSSKRCAQASRCGASEW